MVAASYGRRLRPARVGALALAAAMLSPLVSAATNGGAASFARLPLAFEANRGQTDPEVRYLSRGAGYTLFLTASELVMALPGDGASASGSVVRMRLQGASSASRTEGLEELPGKVSYFRSPDPKRWRANIPTYRKVGYRQIYPGIDLVLYGNERQIEYDFVVAPGADPRTVRLVFAGEGAVRLDSKGDLILATAGGEIVQKAPVAYQQRGKSRTAVAARYVLEGRREARISVGEYDHSRPLVIDPVLYFSTFLGGSGHDFISGIAVDRAGNAYVAGSTTSLNFPNTFGAGGSGQDTFVSKIAANGQYLIYSTYLAGAYAEAIAVDADGHAYVTGAAPAMLAGSFPATAGAFQLVFGGGNSDAFVARLDATGAALDYATYLGGHQDEQGMGIAVDIAETAYVTGWTDGGFPMVNPFQPYPAGGIDGFVTRLDRTGSVLFYSSYLGGSGYDQGRGIAVDPDGNAYVTGDSDSPVFPDVFPPFPQCMTAGNADVIVAKIDAMGWLLYSVCVGGSSWDSGEAIAVDVHGSAYVAGDTDSVNFPVVGPIQPASAGGYDAVVFRLDASGGLLYSTYLGGSGTDVGFGIALDDFGHAYVAGSTRSANFPVLKPLQAFAGVEDVFVSKIDPAGTALVYSTFLGGSDRDWPGGIAVDIEREVYVGGSTLSSNFPVQKPLQPIHASPGLYDGFVLRLH